MMISDQNDKDEYLFLSVNIFPFHYTSTYVAVFFLVWLVHILLLWLLSSFKKPSDIMSMYIMYHVKCHWYELPVSKSTYYDVIK